MMLICYHGENPYIINQQRADLIIGVMADPRLRSILNCIKDEFKNVKQISSELKLSVSTTYRYIHELDRKMSLFYPVKFNLVKKHLHTRVKFVKLFQHLKVKKLTLKFTLI